MNKFNNVIESQQFDRSDLEFIFLLTKVIKDLFLNQQGGKMKLKKLLRYKKILTLFYEESTRTRMSFSLAANHLGIHVFNIENPKVFSSMVKGESLEDTLRVLLGYYFDTIIMRHTDVGAAARAAAISDQFNTPLINAGDGTGQHPTQALLDIFTIWERFGTIEGLTVLMGGDLKNGRTVHSLTYLLAKFPGVKIQYVSPKELQMKEDLLRHLEENNIPYECFTEDDTLTEILKNPNVVYWTRVQAERMDKEVYERVKNLFQINAKNVVYMKDDAILMHPLPRVEEGTPGKTSELTKDVDGFKQAWYFKQSDNGMFVRMALLLMLLDSKKAFSLIKGYVAK